MYMYIYVLTILLCAKFGQRFCTLPLNGFPFFDKPVYTTDSFKNPMKKVQMLDAHKFRQSMRHKYAFEF